MWIPFYPISIYAVLLCLYLVHVPVSSGCHKRVSQVFLVYILSKHIVFLHFCLTLNRSCGPDGHSLTWLVYSCLSHLAECESP